MCGIAGLVHRDLSPIDPEVLRAMSFSMRHRGPDDLGYAGLGRDGEVRLDRDANAMSNTWLGLAHRRLAILDLTEEGRQPMVSPDGRYVIVYNGEVYNYLELREELAGLGHQFRSTSDTEVVLHAYSHWGRAALTRFVGMFAMVVLDIEDETLFLARDQFGIKPLYYTFQGSIFAFASEIKTLLCVPEVPRRANAQVVFDYLRFARSDYGGGTFFESICQIPPAHLLEIPLKGGSRPSPVRYWDLDLTRTTDLSFEEASRDLRDMLMNNVRIHLRSDVPVGAALSGGIDSSSIVACVRRLEPGAELHTFTYVADTPEEGEKRWALAVSRETQATFHTAQPSEQNLVRDLDELVYVLDQPFGSTNMYSQFLVYRLARQNGIKVVLDGQGADELMGGYGNFYADRIRKLLHPGNVYSLAKFLWSASRVQPEFSAAIVLFQSLLGTLPMSLQNACRRVLGRGIYPDWMSRDWIACHRLGFRPETDSHHTPCLRHSLYRSLMVDSLPMLLRWQDRNSMAHSVESRVPFLTARLAEWMFRLPEEYLIANDGTRKAVLRSAMEGLVPSSVLGRRDKVAFGSPMGRWLGRLVPWVEAILASDVVHHIPAFDPRGLQRSWQEVVHGRRPLGGGVWRWISLIKWTERFDVQWDGSRS